MATNDDEGGSPLEMWGQELRFYRTRAGLSQEELGERISYSAKTVSAVETGRMPPAADFAARCDDELDTGGALTRWRTKLVGWSVLPTWFRPWMGVEAEATLIRSNEDFVMPGLLQTEAYARALLGTEQKVATRLERQRILDREDPLPPTLQIVIEESVLIRPVGGPQVMADQIEHLISMCDRPNIRVQVIPMGAYPAATGSFALATMPNESVAYLDTAARGLVTHGKEDIATVELEFGLILAEALPQRASLDMMREQAEKWRST